MSARPLLSVSHLSKSFGRIVAIDDVSFEVRPGELLGLIGPNGAGKTTLFACLAGVLPQGAGEVEAASGLLRTPRERARLMFYVPDGIRPYADQPVGWVLRYAAGFFRGHASAIDELVHTLDLVPLLHQRVGALSKGQAKRTLLALGLLTPQPLLLIDEPFEGLDLRQTREVAGVLRTHTSRGRALFLSIHQIADAARVCDRLVLLSGGRVRGVGTPAELVAAGRATDLEEAFLALT